MENSITPKQVYTVLTDCIGHIITLLVLYECETWSFTLKEEHVLRLFEHRVLRKLFEVLGLHD
jgi:hypothetical protein